MTEQAFHKTYLPLADTLYRVACYILESEAEAEDAVQEVFLQLWETRERLDDIQSPKAYSIRLLKNRCLNRIRQARQLSFQAELPEREAGRPQDEAMDARTRLDKVLEGIIRRSARLLDVPIDDKAAVEIALRSRGTPRIANSLLRRVRDFAQVKGSGRIDLEIARYALEALNIDKYGLDEIDNKILLTIIDKFNGGPVGLNTIATAMNEDAGTIEEVYEPYLIKEGFINRTPRGREATMLAYNHLKRERPGEVGSIF